MIKWEGRKLWFGLPFSFTKYRLEDDVIIKRQGFLSRSEEQTQLYRIVDIDMRQSLVDIICHTGTIKLISKLGQEDCLLLEHIKNPETVKRLINKEVNKERQRNNIRVRENLDDEIEEEENI